MIRTAAHLWLLQVIEYAWGSPATALPEHVDVVLCSDLLYDPAGWGALVTSLRELAARGAVIYLAFRLRNPLELGFFELLQDVDHDGLVCVELSRGKRVGENEKLRRKDRIWRHGCFPDVRFYTLFLDSTTCDA